MTRSEMITQFNSVLLPLLSDATVKDLIDEAVARLEEEEPLTLTVEEEASLRRSEADFAAGRTVSLDVALAQSKARLLAQ